MYCTECGAILTDGVKFCSSCGVKVEIQKELTSGEKSSNQVDDVIIEEIGLAIKSVQEENNRKYKYYVVALLLIYVAIFHDLGMGISYTDFAGMDCQSSDYDPSGYTEIDEVLSELDTEFSEWCQETKGEAQLIVFVAFAGAAFCVWQANKPSKNEEIQEEIEKNQEEIEKNQEEIALSPLEKNKATLKRIKLAKESTFPIVLFICIYYISLIIIPTDTGLHEAWVDEQRGQYSLQEDGLYYYGERIDAELMLNSIEALDVNTCLDKSANLFIGDFVYSPTDGTQWIASDEKEKVCNDLAISAKETITESVAIMLLSTLIGYFVLKKSKERITNIQDSIAEMEEE